MNSYIKFDKVASVYNWTRPVSQEIIQFFNKQTADFLYKSFGKGPYRLCSIGIGSGRVEQYLHSKSFHQIGIDISLEMLKHLQTNSTHLKNSLILGDAVLLPLRSFFHTCIAIHLVHLLNNVECFLKEIERISLSFIQGELYTDLYNNPIGDIYFDDLKKRNWTKKNFGLEGEQFEEFMSKRGYKPILQKKEKLASLPMATLYEIYKKQYLSSLWDVPIKIHYEIMNEIDERVENGELDLKKEIKTLSKADLRFYHLNNSSTKCIF